MRRARLLERAGLLMPRFERSGLGKRAAASQRRLCHLSSIAPAPQRFEELITRCVQFCSSAAGSRELRQPNRLLPTPPLSLDSTLCSRVTYVHVFERIAESRERREPTPAGPVEKSFRFFHFAPTRRTHITKC